MIRLLSLVTSALLLALALPAAAQEATPLAPSVPGPAPGVRAHDGFFLQLQLGLSAMSLEHVSGGMKLDGTGRELDIRIGGSPVDDLVLFGEVTVKMADAPTAELEGRDLGSDPGTTMTCSIMGLGLGVYLPLNLFVSLTGGPVRAEFADDYEALSWAGWGAQLQLGKEWWVSEQWGLGLAANYLLARAAIDSVEVRDDLENSFDVRSFGLLFSATYQ